MLDDLIHDLAPFLVLGAFLVFGCGSYLVWPSRWNIPAHLSLGFAGVAYVVPILFLGQLSEYPKGLVVELTKVMTLGAFFLVAGMLLGANLVQRARVAERWAPLARVGVQDRVRSRTLAVFVAALLGLAAAIALMGFIPMFADDPFSAKFFRGQYADAYRPVAPLFRGATSIITALIPVAAAWAWSRVGFAWKLALGVSVGLMAVTLQRGPAFSGLLIFVGVVLASRRKTLWFLLLVLMTYIAGTLMYYVLGQLGVESFEGKELTDGSFLRTIAATAPDIPDLMSFLERWHRQGSGLTLGRTFWGGLVPGNFAWNPGVWTVTLGDPNYDISTTSSGGLRLPMPVWGLVSFGVPGVMLVALASGLFVGLWARIMDTLIQAATDLVDRTWILVLGASVRGLTSEFYLISYIDVVEFTVIVAIVWAIRGTTRQAVGSPAAWGEPTTPPKRRTGRRALVR